MLIEPVFAALFGFAAVYAGLIYIWRKSPYSFTPDWTWVTVVIGVMLILIHLWYLESHGIVLTLRLIFVAFAIAGFPIAIEEVIAWRERRRARNGRNGGGNGPTH